jgi:GT2 family glycosyltransferase
VRVSLVVVSHYSSEVLPACVAGFRAEAHKAGVEAEVVVVEQSEDHAEAEAVRGADVDLTIVNSNRGYAAGLNVGAEAAHGEVLLLANPDVVFLEESLGAMLRGLEEGFDVVGPQFVWDDSAEFLLPAAEDPSPRTELWRTIRRRWQRPWAVGLDRTLEESWRIWSARGTVAVPCLRGALLAVPRSAITRFGPLDEGYFLYYEETEWLWRARGLGARLAVAADARVEHRWGHSTVRRDDRDQLEEDSRQRFFRRNYGPLWRFALRRSAGGQQPAGAPVDAVTGPEAVPQTPADLWLVSTFRHFVPAGGSIGRSTLPPSVTELAAEGRWYALAAAREPSGWRTLGGWTWCRP